MQCLKGKQAVFVCAVPPTWKPQRLWDVPAEILSAHLHAKNLSMTVALGFARAHNSAQVMALVNEHLPIDSWEIVMRHLKPDRRAASNKHRSKIIAKGVNAKFGEVEQ